MKFFKWKQFLITSSVCLLPVLIGVLLWNRLPESIATHFNFNGEPDSYSTQSFAVFGLPLIMVAAQFACCLITDINGYKHGERKKFENVINWIIPFMTIVLQLITFGYALGFNIDIRRVVAFIVGCIFLVIGNYMPKLDYIKNYDVDANKARKINRFIGYETVAMGILFIISMFLSPAWAKICLFLLIPYAIINIVYTLVVIKRQ